MNSTNPLTVSLIFDLDFGKKMIALAETSVIWACDSRRNDEAAVEARKSLEGKTAPALDSISIFEFERKASMFVSFREILSTFEYHHPWTILNVYGTELSSIMKESLLNEFEASSVETTDFGFRALRPSST